MVNLANIRKKAKEKRQEPPAGPDSTQTPAVTHEDVTPVAAEAASAPQPEPRAPEPEAPKSGRSKDVAPKKAAQEKAPKTKAEEPESPEPADEPEPELPQTHAARSKLDAFKESAGVNRFDGGAEAAAEGTGEALRELLTFGLAGEHYAIDIESIVEITPPRQATRIPNADPGVVGIISLRGTIVTVLNLRQILGHPSQVDSGPDARIIVLEQGGQTSGFLVDRVYRVAKIGRGALASAPVVSTAEQSAYIEGVFYHNNVLTIVLNLDRLLKG